MSVETDKKTEGIALITAALEEIKVFIEGKKGSFKIKEAVLSVVMLAEGCGRQKPASGVAES